MSLVGTINGMNWRKNGFPAVMFCPFEKGFNLEMSLGEGVVIFFPSPYTSSPGELGICD